ncbi:hypothetical protein LTR66_005504 [Elasticomyces elasticus]|nr:hypothetical protein LTR28_011004 [Elasticomyces elasticus]KAK4994485.1 hypothetical protein LTR66_005504 [Elasticomyces elasticus]
MSEQRQQATDNTNKKRQQVNSNMSEQEQQFWAHVAELEEALLAETEEALKQEEKEERWWEDYLADPIDTMAHEGGFTIYTKPRRMFRPPTLSIETLAARNYTASDLKKLPNHARRALRREAARNKHKRAIGYGSKGTWKLLDPGAATLSVEGTGRTEDGWEREMWRDFTHSKAEQRCQDERRREGFERKAQRKAQLRQHKDARQDEETTAFSAHQAQAAADDFQAWRPCTSVLADKTIMGTVPEPPAWPCGRAACGSRPHSDRLLRACRHNIADAYTRAGLNNVRDLRDARNRWHPDRFHACPAAVRPVIMARAAEISGALTELLDVLEGEADWEVMEEYEGE